MPSICSKRVLANFSFFLQYFPLRLHETNKYRLDTCPFATTRVSRSRTRARRHDGITMHVLGVSTTNTLKLTYTSVLSTLIGDTYRLLPVDRVLRHAFDRVTVRPRGQGAAFSLSCPSARVSPTLYEPHLPLRRFCQRAQDDRRSHHRRPRPLREETIWHSPEGHAQRVRFREAGMCGARYAAEEHRQVIRDNVSV